MFPTTLEREETDMGKTPHYSASLLLAAARVDPVLRKAAEEVQDALIDLDRLRKVEQRARDMAETSRDIGDWTRAARFILDGNDS